MWHKHFSVNVSLIFAFIPLTNLAYVILIHAKTLDVALVATKMTFMGGCFLILFITFYIFNMCQVKMPKFLILLMMGISIVITFSVLSIGQNKLFYKSVEATKEHGRLVLHKVYAPMHTVYYAFILICFLIGFGVIFYSLKHKNQVSRKIIWLLFIPEMLSVLCFFIGRYAFHYVELIPLSYLFAQIMYLGIAHYICMYDITDNAIDMMIESGMAGFISFDFNMNYLGSNDTAKKIFPELKELTVDKSLHNNEKLWSIFIPMINKFRKAKGQNKFYYGEDPIYMIDVNYLTHRGDKKGFQLVITDDTKNQKYIKLIDHYNSTLESEVKKKTEDILNMHNNLIRSMAMLVESRDNSTGGHIIRTSDVVEMLMNEIAKDKSFVKKNHIDEEFIHDIIKAAPLHDIGKIAVDDDILKKPGRFTNEEFEIMKRHAPEGAKVLHSILKDTDDESFKKLAENVAHYHHERMDGSGYPDGLVGKDIPLEARIMAIADVYDALVSKRVYKDSMSFEKADSIMMESMGKHFDPELEKFYIAARPKMEKYYEVQNKLAEGQIIA
ncbi:MAG: HD domain-containing protein [Lachnospiraceae bacterium]|nr:HD domain-containing protein [Lachnospiraceae bacterium]